MTASNTYKILIAVLSLVAINYLLAWSRGDASMVLFVVPALVAIGCTFMLGKQKAAARQSASQSVETDSSAILTTEVAGVFDKNGDRTPRQNIIRNYCRRGGEIRLSQDTPNEHSDVPFSVWCKGGQIGFLPDQVALNLAYQISMGKRASARILKVTGKDSGKYGINIEITLRK